MKAVKIAAYVLVVGILGSSLWWALDPTVRLSQSHLPDELGQSEPTVAELSRSPERQRVVTAPASEGAKNASKTDMLAGRVRDAQGHSVADVEVRFERRRWKERDYVVDDESFVTMSDAGGQFKLPFPGRWGRLVVNSESYVTLLDAALSSKMPDRDLVLIVAPRVSYGGVITDETGGRLSGVTVQIAMDPSLVRSLRPGVRRSQTPIWTTKTDDKGHFSLPDVGWTTGMRLRTRLIGYKSVDQELPRYSMMKLMLSMRRIRGNASAVSGDHEGRFVFANGRTGEQIIAAAHAFLPGRYDLPASIEDVGIRAITIVLSGKTLTITGSVVDARGNPISGTHVWTRDGERVVRGQHNDPRFLEEIIGVQGNALASGPHQRSDKQGRFKLVGLLQRSYTLYAIHARTSSSDSKADLAKGKSEVISSDERARTLVLCKAGKELRRVPIRLRPGEVQVIRL